MYQTADPALVIAARDGDRDALAELLAAHLPLVYTVVSRSLSGHADVDDIVQETMLRAVQGLPALREPERFRSWLIAIAVRKIHDRTRRLVRRPSRLDEADPADPGADFVDEAIARVRLSAERQAVVEASRWLTPDDRRVLALWWQELLGNLTRSEIADALGLTIAHTGVRIQRMRAHLTRARLILAAWRAVPRCAELADAARGWNGGDEPRWQKRLHRHVRDCPRCIAAGSGLAPVDTVLGQIGLLPVAAALLPSVLAAGSTGATGAAGTAGASLWGKLGAALTAKPAVTAASIAGAVAAIVAVTALAPDTVAPPPVAAPPPSAVAVGPTPTSALPTRSAPPPTPPPVQARSAIYLSPTGSDTGDGTPARPYASLAKAVAVVRPGQTIVAGGGTYRPAQSVGMTTDGTATKRITVTNAPGERPIFDATAIPATEWFITQTADYWTVRGLEIRNAPSHPYVCRSCRHDTFSQLSIHDNGGTGLLLRDPGTEDNQVLDSDFYRNRDHGGADGVSFKWGSGAGNVVRGCRFWSNVDDGLDLHEFTDPVTIDRNWAYGNGVDLWHDPALASAGAGNGFRLGGGNPAPAVAHVVTNSAAWDNTGYGFTESANKGVLRLTNNSAYHNGKDGFAFFFSDSVFQHNLALGNGRDAVLAATAVQDGNSWNQSGWTTGALLERDPGTAQGARNTTGRLPATAFLTNSRDAAVGAPMTG